MGSVHWKHIDNRITVVHPWDIYILFKKIQKARTQMFEFWKLTKERAHWIYVKVKEFVIRDNHTELTDDEIYALDKDDTEESSIDE